MIAVAAAVLSAALYALAVPPWSLDVLAPVALVPLLLALRGRTTLLALGLGLAFALAFAAAAVWWLPAMITHFFAVSPVRATLGAIGVYLAVAGLPFALQLVQAPGGDTRLLGAALWCERALDPAAAPPMVR